MDMQIRLSPTSIADFKRCPQTYRLKHIEQIHPVIMSDNLRQGLNWHDMMELYQNHLSAGHRKDDAFEAAIDRLNEHYSGVPAHKTSQEWLEERTMLASMFAGYHWYYCDDELETVATEHKYELPLIDPRVGMPVPTDRAVMVGKIDRVVRWNGRLYVMEYKTTGRKLDAQSDYWEKWRKDCQFTSYVYATRELQKSGELASDEPLCEGVLLDAVKKPSISMKRLSQKDTKEFIETGEYFGTKFKVALNDEQDGEAATIAWVDDEETDVKFGKSGNPAIRETPEMYGARLLADIYANPEQYFVRREVPRTESDMQEFKREVYAVYSTIRGMLDSGCWYRNESAGEPGYKSEYEPLLNHNDVEELLASGQVPDGFYKRGA